MKYKVLIFDADETLFDFKKAEKEAFKETILEFGMDYDESYHFETYKVINSAIWKELEQGLITQSKLKIERFKRLSNKLQIPFDEVEFANAYMKHLANGSFLFEDSTDLIESIKDNYTLMIVTNGLTVVQEKRIKQSTIAKYFKNIVISENIGVSKPNPGIFEYTLKDMKNIDKSQVLMIGDSLSSDIQGGTNFGIDTCWYNPKEIENKTNLKPTYEVKSLKELKDLLLNI